MQRIHDQNEATEPKEEETTVVDNVVRLKPRASND